MKMRKKMTVSSNTKDRNLRCSHSLSHNAEIVFFVHYSIWSVCYINVVK